MSQTNAQLKWAPDAVDTVVAGLQQKQLVDFDALDTKFGADKVAARLERAIADIHLNIKQGLFSTEPDHKSDYVRATEQLLDYIGEYMEARNNFRAAFDARHAMHELNNCFPCKTYEERQARNAQLNAPWRGEPPRRSWHPHLVKA